MAAGTPVGRMDMLDQEFIDKLGSLDITGLNALAEKGSELLELAANAEELLALLASDPEEETTE